MGAIEQGGYRFEIEYSVLLQKGGLHVYKDGEFLEEIEFAFTGEKPEANQIENLVDTFLKTHPHTETFLP
ncbi:YbxH family protein [Microbacteriaceae bacterium 4G12]